MTIALGIDTGGTYTDAVLVDHSTGRVLAKAKSLTSYPDLSLGIRQAMTQVFSSAARLAERPALTAADVGLVSLSTTLATNAIVEGKGCAVCLMLIGYDPGLIRDCGFENQLVTQDIVYLQGGHDGAGDEVAPLDELAVRETILARRQRVEAFAVSGYFSVRNPAHELRVRSLVTELMPGTLVTCGHELTAQLNSVRRATTVALNARLIPLLRDLIATVHAALEAVGIAAPLMLVKGDGSLVRAEWAKNRPVETILSGPAASVVGAWHLAGRRDAWTVDVGGTTTDISALRDGHPRLHPEGAQVGPWRTMAQAVDVHTVGLGGDSHVQMESLDRIIIGPRRVTPLCLLASLHPEVLAELERQAAQPQLDDLTAQFVVRLQRPALGIADEDLALLDQLGDVPRALCRLGDQARHGRWVMSQVERLEAQRLVLRAGFTPTDALHALGRFGLWRVEASRLGARILGRQANLAADALCERVVTEVADRVTQALVTKVLTDEGEAGPLWAEERTEASLLMRALDRVRGSDLGCALTLNKPIIAIGAPVKAYLPQVADHLNTELIIPEHADVANAVGAVAGSVVQRLQALIRPLDGHGQVRLHLPEAVLDFPSVTKAVTYAEESLRPAIAALARQAGAADVEVIMSRKDNIVQATGGFGQPTYLGTDLIFTAVGRPNFARRG